MILGLFWPLDNTALVLQVFSKLMPLPIAIKAVQAILIRGREFNTELIPYSEIFIIFWILISFTTFILKLRDKINYTIL